MKKIFMSIIFLNFIQPAQGMLISETCYNNWQAIKEDAAKLDCYFKGVFEAFGENNQAKAKPSELLKFIRDKSDINSATKLTYRHATTYLNFIIEKTDYDLLDTLFIEKYHETKNVQLASKALYDYFSTHLIKEKIGLIVKICSNVMLHKFL